MTRRITYGIDDRPDFAGDAIICVYVDDRQVAAAVQLGDVYAEATGCRYHVTSHLATPLLKPLLCHDKNDALAWLDFLADLYEGKHHK